MKISLKNMARSIRSVRRSLVRSIVEVASYPQFVFRRWTPKRWTRLASQGTQKTLQKVVAGSEATGRPRRRWIDFLWGLPSLVALVAVAGVSFRVVSQERRLGQSYLQKGLASAAGDRFQEAQIYLTRAMKSGGTDSREIQFTLAVVWEKLGYSGRALQAMQRLAPSDRRGYAKAHRHLAMLIALQAARQTPSNEMLGQWLWHLTHADGQRLPEIQESWGNYYLAVDDMESAIGAFQNAAEKLPRLYLAIGNLQSRLGRLDLRDDALEKSRQSFQVRLSEDPTDTRSRVAYASTLLQLGELSEAERVLRTGIRLDPDGPFEKLLAATFVQLHDKLRERGSKFQSLALQYLKNALEFDANFTPALNRLLGYARANQDSIGELEALMNQILVSGKGTSLAHLALSNLAWIRDDRDRAAFHLEQAMELDADMPVIANNFAWILAHDEEPELERALRIISLVVQRYPKDHRFLDTRGTVLVLLERYQEGLVDLEKALPGLRDQRAARKRIADVYRRLGMDDIADEHDRRIKNAGPQQG